MSKTRLVYELYINETKVNPQPFDVVIEPGIGKISVVTAKLFFSGPDQIRRRMEYPKHGTPVRLVWGRRPKIRTWYGYIHHTQPTTGEPQALYGGLVATYVMVGTGQGLIMERTRDWRQITDSGIAKQIAQEYGLSFVGHRTRKVHDYLYQPGISDFSWLKQRAEKSSRVLHIENGTLYFVDPASLAMATRSNPLTVRMDRVKEHDDWVLDVRPLHGSLVPISGKQANRQLTGIDYASNQLLKAKSPASEPAPEWVARNREIASVTDLYIDAEALAIANEQWLKADVDMIGEPDAIPGNLLDLQGEAVKPELTGVWMVTEARHHLHLKDPSAVGAAATYYATATVSRNSSDALILRDRSLPRVDDACTLMGGRWVAANRRDVLL